MASYRVMMYCLLIPPLIGLGACSRSQDDTRARTRETPAAKDADFAWVRYINALSAHAGADLYFDDLKVFGAGDRPATDYVQVPAERHEFTIRETGKQAAAPIVKNSEGLRKGAHYTVIAFGDEDGKPAIRVVSDEESAPPVGKAKVRIINSAAGVDGYDLYVTGRKDKLAGKSRFGTVSAWQEVPPVQGPLEFRTENKSAAHIPDVTLQAGKLYTFVVQHGASPEERLQAVVLENSATKLPAPLAPIAPLTSY